MNFTADLSSITWPLAALLALVLLRPILTEHFGGILGAINEIKNMPDKLSKTIEHLSSLQESLGDIPKKISDVDAKLKNLNREVENISYQQSETNEKLKSDEELAQDIREEQKQKSEQNTCDPNFDWATSFEEFKKAWDDFSDNISKRLHNLGLNGQKNFLPLEISKLSEEHTKYNLSKETAEYVQFVYSQNRRIRRIKSINPAVFYTSEYHYDLMSKLNFAKNEIDQVLK